MLKKSICFLLIVLLPCLMFPQDIIHLNDGTKINCKIVSINQETVEIDLGEDSVYEDIQKTHIKVIIYENGNIETFSMDSESTSTYSQDSVQFIDGSKILCKVLSINPETIEISTGEDMPKRTFFKKDIKEIMYKNGEIETFINQQSTEELEKRLTENEMKIEKQKNDLGGVAMLITLGILAIIFISAYRTHT